MVTQKVDKSAWRARENNIDTGRYKSSPANTDCCSLKIDRTPVHWPLKSHSMLKKPRVFYDFGVIGMFVCFLYFPTHNEYEYYY